MGKITQLIHFTNVVFLMGGNVFLKLTEKALKSQNFSALNSYSINTEAIYCRLT